MCGGEGDCDGGAITLRLRLGVVKREPDSESEEETCPCRGSLSAAADLELDSGDDVIALRCRLGFTTTIKQEEADEPPDQGLAAVPATAVRSPQSAADAPSSGKQLDLRGMLLRQQQPQDPNAAGQPERPQEPSAEAAAGAAAQFEEAQTASYDANVADRRQREVRERQLVEEGDLEPLERLDRELMEGLYCHEFSWFGEPDHRRAMHRYLELRTRAVRWYSQPAEDYFVARRLELLEAIEGPDSATFLSRFVAEETEKVEAELFSMPEKGHFAPRLFRAPSRFDNDDVNARVEVD